jgi:chaperone required for assembly of F1-ATPase
MRDIFEDISGRDPIDPMESVRRSLQPKTLRRFYRDVAVAAMGDEFGPVLDGRPVKTPARRPLSVPSRALAAALAAEWAAQQDAIDPGQMPLTRLVNSIIDGVAITPAPVADEIAKYLATDLVLYRAEHPQELVDRQAQTWDPLVAWAEVALGARFFCVQGVMHGSQPASALAAGRAFIPDDPWRLGALHSVTTRTGSALIGLALLAGRLTAAAAWAAANVDEDWNFEKWGRDELARSRRAAGLAEVEAATTLMRAFD